MKLIAILAASLSLAACATTKAAPYHNGRLMSDTRYYYDKGDAASVTENTKAETPAVAAHAAPTTSVAASK